MASLRPVSAKVAQGLPRALGGGGGVTPDLRRSALGSGSLSARDQPVEKLESPAESTGRLLACECMRGERGSDRLPSVSLTTDKQFTFLTRKITQSDRMGLGTPVWKTCFMINKRKAPLTFGTGETAASFTCYQSTSTSN